MAKGCLEQDVKFHNYLCQKVTTSQHKVLSCRSVKCIINGAKDLRNDALAGSLKMCLTSGRKTSGSWIFKSIWVFRELPI